MATLHIAGNVAAIAFNPDGTRLVTVSGTIAQVWAV